MKICCSGVGKGNFQVLLPLMISLFPIYCELAEDKINLEKISDELVSEAVREVREKLLKDSRIQENKNKYEQWMKKFLASNISFVDSYHDKTIAADVLEMTFQVLKEKLDQIHLNRTRRRVTYADDLSSQAIKELISFSGCGVNIKPPECSPICISQIYRALDGACNNEANPWWGAANIPFERWLPAVYENEFNWPLGWTEEELRYGSEIPSARTISKQLLATTNSQVQDDTEYTAIVAAWGSYIAHDISSIPLITGKTTFQGLTNCKISCEHKFPCFSIKVPKGDNRISRDCLPFFRSTAVCGTGDTSSFFKDVLRREQLNAATSFVDGSAVYGSSEKASRHLREFNTDNGLLKINQQYRDNGNRSFLPFNSFSACYQPNTATNVPNCFMAGDSRVSENLMLSVIHTLWLREHNRIAQALKAINPHWSGEIIYQETRKIIGAYHQIITWKEYLPTILGPDGMAAMGVYVGYNATKNPTTSNVFATVASRFTDTIIPTQLRRYDSNMREDSNLKNIPFHQSFHSPWRIIKQGGIDPILRGLIGSPAKFPSSSQIIHDELREKLFALTNQVALDLAAINIQRGRDHGIPPYALWREECQLSALADFRDVASEIPNSTFRARIEAVYSDIRNVDAWVGAVVEDLVAGGRLGPLLTCLISRQFKNLRDGDKFYYQNPGVFTNNQRNALEVLTMSRLICDSSGLTNVQSGVFNLGVFPVDFRACNEFSPLDLQPWREEITVASCGRPQDIKNGYWKICDPKISYQCYYGYEMSGSAEMECINGAFEPSSPPTCSKIAIVDCSTLNGGCEEECQFHNGDIVCSCSKGKEIQEDGKTCIPTTVIIEMIEKKNQDILQNYEKHVNLQAIFLGIALISCVIITLTMVVLLSLKFQDSIMMKIWGFLDAL